MATPIVEIRPDALSDYPDVLTPSVVEALHELAPLDADRQALMAARLERRARRAQDQERIAFLDPASRIGRTAITVADARAGRFSGSDIPHDLQRQWIQGTGPGARPGTPIDRSIRNIAYALLSGAEAGCLTARTRSASSMSLDNQRNLKLAIHRDQCSSVPPRRWPAR
jgi:malate synthase